MFAWRYISDNPAKPPLCIYIQRALGPPFELPEFDWPRLQNPQYHIPPLRSAICVTLPAAKQRSRGHCLFLFVRKKQKKQKNKNIVWRQTVGPAAGWSWNIMTAAVLHLASRINSCSGLIAPCQQGLKAAYLRLLCVQDDTVPDACIPCAMLWDFLIIQSHEQQERRIIKSVADCNFKLSWY